MSATPKDRNDSVEAGLPVWLVDFHEIDLGTLCHRCATSLPGRLGYQNASLYLCDVERSVLTLAETTCTRPIDRAVRLADEPPRLMTRVAAAGRPFETDDLLDGCRKLRLPKPDHPDAYPDRACLIVPLVHAGVLRGIMNFSGRLAGAAPPRITSRSAVFSFIARSLAFAEAYQTVRTEARIDGLTHLFNYRWLNETLDRELRRCQRFNQPLTVLALDLDGLKGINDQHGHAAGDFLLRSVATRIAAALRHCDMAARAGGDEFVVVLPETDLAGAQLVARRVLTSLRQDAPLFRGTPLPITASIGVAQWQPDCGARQLLEAADAAMYTAKRHGRDRIVYTTTTIDTTAGPASAPALAAPILAEERIPSAASSFIANTQSAR